MSDWRTLSEDEGGQLSLCDVTTSVLVAFFNICIH